MDNLIDDFDKLEEGNIYALLKPGTEPTIFRKTGDMDGTKDADATGIPYLYQTINKTVMGSGRFLRLPKDKHWGYTGYREATYKEMTLLVAWEKECNWRQPKEVAPVSTDNYLIIN